MEQAKYCSSDCQTANWPIHKIACKRSCTTSAAPAGGIPADAAGPSFEASAQDSVVIDLGKDAMAGMPCTIVSMQSALKKSGYGAQAMGTIA